MAEQLFFASDYMEGAHQNIIDKLVETNLYHTSGYGTDEYSESARNRIREACRCPGAQVYFISGGTQTNAVVIGAALAPYQGVIAAETGHVAAHEAGAIEYTGHKVLTVKGEKGKLSAESVRTFIEGFYNDGNHEHMVYPGMVYISQPTEFGTLYSLKELTDLKAVCSEYQIPLYMDGARLAYALASPENDASLPDLAKLCDVFYIGGTKCGALFGEAVVIPDPKLIPHFFTIIKQRGALLAKGRIAGIQFDELFKDSLYFKIGENAIKYAVMLKDALKHNGYELYLDSPTNQIFVIMENKKLEELGKCVSYSFWEIYDEDHTVIRLATSWATSGEDVKALIALLEG